MQKIQGRVEKGNTKVTTSGIISTTVVEGSFPLSTVTVYITNTVTLATIYSDAAGTPLSNPFTASSDGSWFFYVAPGVYDVQFSGTGISSPFTIGAIPAVATTTFGSFVSAADFPGTDASSKIASASTAIALNSGGVVVASTDIGSIEPSPIPGNLVDLLDLRKTVDLLTESTTLVDRPVNFYLRSNAGVLSTRALTGTVTLTNGSTSVSGSGTSFTTQLAVGDVIRLSADAESAWAKITVVTNNTSATIAANYTGMGGSGAAVAGLAHIPFAIRTDVTGGQPNTSGAGETVGLSVMTLRGSTGNRQIFGGNFNQTFQSHSAGAASVEFDLNNSSGSDWAEGGEIINGELQQTYAVHVVSAGTHRPQGGILLDAAVGAEFQRGITMLQSWQSKGIFSQAVNPVGIHLYMIPAADNGNAAVVWNNAANTQTQAVVYNDGTAQFKTMTLGTPGSTDVAFSSGPRGTFCCFFPILTATATGLTIKPDRGIVITRVEIQCLTTPVGCTQDASIRVTNGSNPIDTLLTSGSGPAYDSGAVSAAYAAGATVTISIVQAAIAGGGTAPANVNVVVQYRMQ